MRDLLMMLCKQAKKRYQITTLLLALLLGSSGCTTVLEPRDPFPVTPPAPPVESNIPRELSPVSLPRYVVEPPDILLIEGVKLVPKSPHKIETFDVLLVRVEGGFSEQPINDPFNVDADGSVNLGPAYGRIQVVGRTIEEAEDKIRTELSKRLTAPEVSVSLVSSDSGAQPISGQHLVGLDGRVNLGTYGSVYVSGATLEQARSAIEHQLSLKLDSPVVTVDILAYNSKVYYVITEGGGVGETVIRLPITGNETVLDAVSEIGGLSQFSSSKMWIARPAPNGVGCEQILPVDWKSISRGGATATNYQMMPGDRLFVAVNRLDSLGSAVTRLLRPMESIFAFVSLGTSTANRIVRFGLGNTF